MKTIVNENDEYMVPSNTGWFTCEIPHLVADTATVEALKDFYPNLQVDGVRIVDINCYLKRSPEITNEMAEKAASIAISGRVDYNRIKWKVFGRGYNQINVRAIEPVLVDHFGNPSMISADFQIFLNGDLILMINGQKEWVNSIGEIHKLLFK